MKALDMEEKLHSSRRTLLYGFFMLGEVGATAGLRIQSG